jgi:cytochrome c-type biogenesis protein
VFWQEFAISFGLGLVATASPCVLPLYPGYLAYLATLGGEQRGQGRALLYAVLVLLGVLSMMLALGLVMATLQLATGNVLRVVIPLADLLLIGLGLALLLGQNPFARVNLVGGSVSVRQPALAAFVYGLLYGPLALPCSASVVVGVFALSLTVGDFLASLALFLAFGLGFGVPLLVLGLLGSLRARKLIGVVLDHERTILRVAGVLLIGLGAWDLNANWEALQLYWA